MNSLRVIYDKKFVGVCDFNTENNRIYFQYHPDFVKTGNELAPILMPLNNNIYEFSSRTYSPQTFNGLPPMLADSLPDDFGNKMFGEWLLQQHISKEQLNPLEKLCYVGNRGIGALEFEPAFESKITASNINISELLGIANKIYFKKENESFPLNDYHQSLSTLLRISSSVGGARAKALIAINEKTQEIKSGDIMQEGSFRYYLIKFDGLKDGKTIEPSGYGILEYTYHKMAVDAGITMTECRLFEENGNSHFLTERFDRLNGEKTHTQTICGLAGVDFRQPNLIDYADIFRILLVLKTDYSEREQLFRRMIFNELAKNYDDHTKNFSLIYKNQKWQLSPAYDICFAYDPKNFWLKQHNININGKAKNILKDDILTIGSTFGIKNSENILNEIAEIINNFSTYAVKYKYSKNQADKINEVLQNGELMQKLKN